MPVLKPYATRITRRTRRLLATTLLLQYALATWLIPAVHAMLLDGQPVRAAHVESQGTKACQPVHNETGCSVFSVARLVAATPRTTRKPAISTQMKAVAPAATPKPKPKPKILKMTNPYHHRFGLLRGYDTKKLQN